MFWYITATFSCTLKRNLLPSVAVVGQDPQIKLLATFAGSLDGDFLFTTVLNFS